MTAFENGYDSHAKGIARADNPFDKETAPFSHGRWDKGWIARAGR